MPFLNIISTSIYHFILLFFIAKLFGKNGPDLLSWLLLLNWLLDGFPPTHWNSAHRVVQIIKPVAQPQTIFLGSALGSWDQQSANSISPLLSGFHWVFLRGDTRGSLVGTRRWEGFVLPHLHAALVSISPVTCPHSMWSSWVQSPASASTPRAIIMPFSSEVPASPLLGPSFKLPRHRV